MRISFLCHEFPPTGGGAATALDEITRVLVRMGHAAQVITIGLGNSTHCVGQDAWGRSLIRLPAGRSRLLSPSPLELLRSCLSLRFLSLPYLREFAPEIVLAFFAFPAGLMAIPLARKLRVPLAVSLRGCDMPGFYSSRWGIFWSFQDILARPVWRHADVLIANGQYLTDLAGQFMPSKKLVNIPNGVDTKRFYPIASRPTHEPLRLLYVGQFIERKRILEVLQAIQGLDEIPLYMTIVGDGPLRKKMSELAAQVPLGMRVQILGPVTREAMPDIYQKHDLLVHLSRAEGVSNVLLEALASGLGVLTTRSAINEMLTEESCLLIDPVDPERIRHHIRKVAKDPALLAAKQKAARVWSKSNTWRQTTEQYVEILEEVIKKSHRPPGL